MATLSDARRVVVKIGSALLVGEDGLRRDWIAGLAEDVAKLRSRGADVILVSSGSIALGRRSLGLADGVLPLEQSQAAAAVGQIRLARAWEEALAPHGITTAQVLLTLEDSEDRRRYLNSRATLEALLAFGTVPVVNENDTIATDEIRYGDNDRLAAQIAATVGADLAVLLSDVDGFYTGNPKTDAGAEHIPEITAITPDIEAMAGDAGTGLAKGGMKTKLIAARTAMRAGATMVIAEGSIRNPLKCLAEGARATWFRPETDPRRARITWIAAMKPRGEITVDAGAAGALDRGSSLLPAGVTAVAGVFGRGDPVAILGPGGERLGIGLTRYTAAEAAAIRGRRTGDLEAILGYPARSVLIHRDDMAM
ncbi:MAG: glutamate 5-kinase [Paracoccaceae bacterium]|nr:glutamate 5-kinase [Paracoccaceae bacterium]